MSKGRYRIRIEAAEGCNPEYAPSEECRKGIMCDNFVIFGSDSKGRLFSEASCFSVLDLKDAIVEGGYTAGIIRQACAIAEGELKAREIWEESRKAETKKKFVDGILGAIAEAVLSDDDEDEDEDER